MKWPRVTIHRLMPIALGLALTACSIAPPHAADPPFPLLAPATLGATRSALQVVHGAFGEVDLALQCVVDVSPTQLTLIGLSALGQRWFSLRHDGKTLSVEASPQAPPQMDPRRVMADLQLALWPLLALQRALTESEWQITEPAPATRRLRRAGRLVAEVHYAGTDPWLGRLWLSNFEFGYTLAIESQPLP